LINNGAILLTDIYQLENGNQIIDTYKKTGIQVSLIELTLSFYLDLPTGATLVCSFGATFFIALILSKFRFSGQE